MMEPLFDGPAPSARVLNQRNGDERAALHAQDRFYDTAAFLEGASSLRQLDRELAGPVIGRDLPRTFSNCPSNCAGGSISSGPPLLTHQDTVQWSHSLGELVTAFAGAGLRIDKDCEHMFSERNDRKLPHPVDG